jgi:hypothetical protein
MPNYPVNQNQTTVGQFLRQASLNPPVQNANTRVPDLINCHGVIHYTRSGTRTEVSDESFQIERGDFLVVADICATGSSQTIVAAFQASDYAFVMPRDNFGTHAENYMNRRPETRTIVSSNTINSLDAILTTIISGTQITTPVNDVLIVSHANAGGQLFFKLRNSDQANHMTYNQLSDYLNAANRPQITSRQIRDDANIHIRGCNIGKEPRFLQLVKEVFGNNATVTAPKHLDRFAFFTSSGTTHRYENMVYHFIIYNKTALADKQAVEDAFVNHTPAFEDIFGNVITRAQFNTWLPQNINNNSTANHPCTNPIDTQLTVEREFRHQVDNPLYTYNITLDSNPPANQRIDILKQVLADNDTMKSSHPFPTYEQFGYSNLDDFVDNLNWQFNWNNGTKTLNCRGSRHSYQLRIPITDASNNLFVNAFLATGTKQYVHHQVLETDSRFFGSV